MCLLAGREQLLFALRMTLQRLWVHVGTLFLSRCESASWHVGFVPAPFGVCLHVVPAMWLGESSCPMQSGRSLVICWAPNWACCCQPGSSGRCVSDSSVPPSRKPVGFVAFLWIDRFIEDFFFFLLIITCWTRAMWLIWSTAELLRSLWHWGTQPSGSQWLPCALRSGSPLLGASCWGQNRRAPRWSGGSRGWEPRRCGSSKGCCEKWVALKHFKWRRWRKQGRVFCAKKRCFLLLEFVHLAYLAVCKISFWEL